MPQATGIGRATINQAHSALSVQTQIFEQCTRDLAGVCDRLLRKHGKQIVDRQFATRRLADIMIDLFALACVISRVSTTIQDRGLTSAEKEREILQVLAGQVQRRVRGNMSKIDQNDDELIKSL